MDASLVETNVAFCSEDVPLHVQFLKTTWAFCSKGYVLVCAVVENEGAFCSKGKSPYVKVVETKGSFVAQQPHCIAPSLRIIFVTELGYVRVTMSPLKFDGGSIRYF